MGCYRAIGFVGFGVEGLTRWDYSGCVRLGFSLSDVAEEQVSGLVGGGMDETVTTDG